MPSAAWPLSLSFHPCNLARNRRGGRWVGNPRSRNERTRCDRHRRGSGRSRRRAAARRLRTEIRHLRKGGSDRLGLAAPLRPAASAHAARSFGVAGAADAGVVRALSLAHAIYRLSPGLCEEIRLGAHIRHTGSLSAAGRLALARRGGRKLGDDADRRRGHRLGRLPQRAEMAGHGGVRRPDRPFQRLSQRFGLRGPARARRRLRQFWARKSRWICARRARRRP